MANRFMKFYPSDWRAEKRLKLISRAARSLWIDMLGLMFDEGTGRLEVEGRPMTVKELALTLGDNPRTTKKLLAEIEDMGVSSRDENGFICSRRIIRDFEKAEQDKSNGRKGGNPTLKTRGNDKKGVNPEVKTQIPDTRYQIEESKASSTAQETAGDYEKYLKAHPKPTEGPAGERAFDALVAEGVDPATIIAAARSYAVASKTFSNKSFIQQSDNFLDPDRGKWRAHVPQQAKPKATQAEVLDFYAKVVIGKKPTAASTVSPQMAHNLLAANLVTKDQLNQAGVQV